MHACVYFSCVWNEAQRSKVNKKILYNNTDSFCKNRDKQSDGMSERTSEQTRQTDKESEQRGKKYYMWKVLK